MSDYAKTIWRHKLDTDASRIPSVTAITYQRLSKVQGLARFLIGPECAHYLAMGLNFIGVKYGTERHQYWWKPGYVSGEPNEADYETLPVNNITGDLAIFIL